MQRLFDGVRLLFPKELCWETWMSRPADRPFSDPTLDLLASLSAALLKDAAAKQFPDVVTFAFFCRRANLLALKAMYGADVARLGRGTVFHVAPSNVPINFAYSLVAGLLAGNRNIVRVSSTEFPQVDIVAAVIERVAEFHPEAAGRIVLVRYDRSSLATRLLSAECDVRVIWGGDETIATIRQNPLPARSFDLTFADRYSFGVIGAEAANEEKDLTKLAEAFYNDTYLFDQNACSAPHLIVWLGAADAVESAKALFWGAVHNVVRKKYALQATMSVRKVAAFFSQAVALPIRKQATPDNLLWRVSLQKLQPEIEAFRCAGGYFAEFDAQSLDDIAPIVSSKFQTMAYFGVERQQLAEFVQAKRLAGIDRIVPFGATTNFSLTWDGYDLIQTLSRKVELV